MNERMLPPEVWRRQWTRTDARPKASSKPRPVHKYHADIAACKKSRAWGRALSLLKEMTREGAKPEERKDDESSDQVYRRVTREFAAAREASTPGPQHPAALQRAATERLFPAHGRPKAKAPRAESSEGLFGVAVRRPEPADKPQAAHLAGLGTAGTEHLATLAGLRSRATARPGHGAGDAPKPARPQTAPEASLGRPRQAPQPLRPSTAHGSRLAEELELFSKVPKKEQPPPPLPTPDIVACTHTMELLATTGEWERCLELLEELKCSGTEPNKACYAHAMVACEKAEQYPLTTELLTEMQFRSLDPTVHCYNAAIDAYCKSSKWEHALELCQRMEQRKVLPIVSGHYCSQIQGCKKSGKWQEAVRLMGSLKQHGVTPDVRSYENGMHVCLEADRPRKALALGRELERRGLPPSTHAMNLCLEAHLAQGQWQQCLRQLRRLSKEGVMPDAESLARERQCHELARQQELERQREEQEEKQRREREEEQKWFSVTEQQQRAARMRQQREAQRNEQLMSTVEATLAASGGLIPSKRGSAAGGGRRTAVSGAASKDIQRASMDSALQRASVNAQL